MSKQEDKPIKEFGNLTIKGKPMITMAENATKNKPTSRDRKHKARLSPETMSDIITEAKKLVFLNSAQVATANKQSKDMMKPRDALIIKNSSRDFNHLHAVRTVIYQPK